MNSYYANAAVILIMNLLKVLQGISVYGFGNLQIVKVKAERKESLMESGISSIFLLGLFLIGILGTVLWIWSLIHCILNKNMSDNNRIIGVVVIVVLGLLGSLIYLFIPNE